MPATFTSLHAFACLLGLAACIADLRTRRIPNALTLGAALAAVMVQGVTLGWRGLVLAVLGWVVGLLLLLPLFLLRGMGGGDVKLLAAFGAWVGPRLVVWTGLYGAIAGGVLALGVTLWHGVFRQTVANLGVLTTHWRVAGLGPVDGLTLATARGPKLPYAVPLTCGLLVAIWLKA